MDTNEYIEELEYRISILNERIECKDIIMKSLEDKIKELEEEITDFQMRF